MPSIDPTVWGPSVWRALHLIALGYPPSPTDEDIRSYGAFFSALAAVIPCDSCSVNYRRHLIELPIEPFLVDGRLFEWTVRLHSLVNAELGKADPDWTADRARRSILDTPSPSDGDKQNVQDEAPRRQTCDAYIYGVVAVLALCTAILAVLYINLRASV